MKKTLKWIGIGLGGLLGVLALALGVLYFMGNAKVNQQYDVPLEAISIPTDAQSIQHGEHLATIYICLRCHTANLGGELYFEVPGMVSISTPNLTSGAGGGGSSFTDADWVRAIRHGVGPDGRALFIMPSNSFSNLSAKDLGALIAYLKSVPPVDNVLPEKRVELLGKVMMAVGMFPPLAVDKIDHSSPPPAAPEPGVTAEYGKYLAITCVECHGPELNGAPFGPPGQEVPTPNLTPGGELSTWTEADFLLTMRSGMTPEGSVLDIEMPWMYFGKMTDNELKALWMFLQALPALEQGGVG